MLSNVSGALHYLKNLFSVSKTLFVRFDKLLKAIKSILIIFRWLSTL